MNKKKLTNFEYFKKALEFYVNKLGLSHWDIEVDHVKDEESDIITPDSLAGIAADPRAYVAQCHLNKNRVTRKSTLARVAAHEAIHLLMSKYSAIAKDRFVGEHELDDEEEKIAMILEKALVVLVKDIDFTSL